MNRKRVPSYWWDFTGDLAVQVLSSDPDFPPARFSARGEGGYEGAIAEAEALIADLAAGRQTPKGMRDELDGRVES